MAFHSRNATGIILLFASLGFASCTGSDPAPTEDAFFTPHAPGEFSVSPGAFRAATQDALSRTSAFPSDALFASLQVQHDRLEAISRRLDALTDSSPFNATGLVPSLPPADSAATIDGTVSSILALLDAQNSRLESVLSRLESVLAMQHHQSPAADPRLSSRRNGNSGHLLADAIRQYRQGDFRTALARLSALRSQAGPLGAGVGCDFWAGMTHFQLRNLDRAKDLFAQVVRRGDARYTDGAYLMLAQCYRQTGAVQLAGGLCRRMLQESPRSTPPLERRINRSAPESIGGNLIRSADSSSLLTLHEASVR